MTFDPRFFMQLLFQSSVTVDNKRYLQSSEVKTGSCCTFMATWLRIRQSSVSLVWLVTAIHSSHRPSTQCMITKWYRKFTKLYTSLCWRHRETVKIFNFRCYKHEISVFFLQTSHGEKVSALTPLVIHSNCTDSVHKLRHNTHLNNNTDWSESLNRESDIDWIMWI